MVATVPSSSQPLFGKDELSCSISPGLCFSATIIDELVTPTHTHGKDKGEPITPSTNSKDEWIHKHMEHNASIIG